MYLTSFIVNLLFFAPYFRLPINVNALDKTLIIPLNKTTTINNKELFSEFVNINSSSTLIVNFSNINKNVSFIIFQVHSHLYNITLYNNTLVQGSYINGTNVGMYSSVKPMLDKFYIYNSKENGELKLFITVHGYGVHDPIPGGCNMELPVPVSPFLRTSYNKDYILVDAAAAKDYRDTNCNSINYFTKVTFYKIYLPEYNFDPDIYFDGIRKMVTLEQIEENGELIPVTAKLWNMRRMLSAYPGVGSIYVAVAYTDTGYSIYVPTHTYACSPLKEFDCELLDDDFTEFLCACLLFIGLFMCYFGHRFFKTELFFIGLLSGYFIAYIFISLTTDYNLSGVTLLSLLFGIFCGAVWTVSWWFYGIPIFAVLLSSLNVGVLLTATTFNVIPDHSLVMHDDTTFWLLFVLMALAATLMLTSMTLLSNIVCSAIIGAFATVYPIDYYVGSSLKYILINTIRRAVVPNYNKANMSIPFQKNDFMVFLLWLILAVTGSWYQYRDNRGRPPFPPPDRSMSIWMPDPPNYGATAERQRRIPPNSRPRPANPPLVRENERTPLLS